MCDAFRRVMRACGCGTQKELASFWGITQYQLNKIKKRREMPAHWLQTLKETKDVNPEWVLTGVWPAYLSLQKNVDPPRYAADCPVQAFLIRALSVLESCPHRGGCCRTGLIKDIE